MFHPAYAAVSLGLLHGSQPDTFVVCHDAARREVLGYEDYPLPSLEECIELTVANGKRLNPDIRCVGISLNTSGLPLEARDRVLTETSERLGLPCVDPMTTGTHAIIERLLAW